MTHIDLFIQNLGWTARVRVDGQTYSVLGEPDISLGVIPANQTSVSFTATQTIFNHQAGPVAITLAFISPIAVSDPFAHRSPSLFAQWLLMPAIRLCAPVYTLFISICQRNLTR